MRKILISVFIVLFLFSFSGLENAQASTLTLTDIYNLLKGKKLPNSCAHISLSFQDFQTSYNSDGHPFDEIPSLVINHTIYFEEARSCKGFLTTYGLSIEAQDSYYNVTYVSELVGRRARTRTTNRNILKFKLDEQTGEILWMTARNQRRLWLGPIPLWVTQYKVTCRK